MCQGCKDSDRAGRLFFRPQVIFVDSDQVVRTDLAELYGTSSRF